MERSSEFVASNRGVHEFDADEPEKEVAEVTSGPLTSILAEYESVSEPLFVRPPLAIDLLRFDDDDACSDDSSSSSSSHNPRTSGVAEVEVADAPVPPPIDCGDTATASSVVAAGSGAAQLEEGRKCASRNRVGGPVVFALDITPATPLGPTHHADELAQHASQPRHSPAALAVHLAADWRHEARPAITTSSDEIPTDVGLRTAANNTASASPTFSCSTPSAKGRVTVDAKSAADAAPPACGNASPLSEVDASSSLLSQVETKVVVPQQDAQLPVDPLVTQNPLVRQSSISTHSSSLANLDPQVLAVRDKLLQFLRRITVNETGSVPGESSFVAESSRAHVHRTNLIDVHRLKRVIHAAKITLEQRACILPVASQGKKFIAVEVCLKALEQAAEKDLAAAISVVDALGKLNDAVVNSQESVFSLIEDRLARIVSDNRAKFADNTVRRVWDTVHLFTMIVFFYLSLSKNVLQGETDLDGPDNDRAQFATLVVFSVFWLLDAVASCFVYSIDRDGRLVKDVRSIILLRRPQLVVDALGILPVDFILECSGAPFPAFLAFRVLKFVKLARLSYLYELVNRDIITSATVTFHFQIKKVIVGVAWLAVFILSMAAVHNLLDIFFIAPHFGRQYPRLLDSITAVCAILSGSNADLEIWVAADKVLYIFLAILSTIGIGLIVGQLTSLVFSHSVQSENYQLMRDTLGIISHYNVPRSIQREVLSFQMHALDDDVVRHLSILSQLPPRMQQEIMMYVKIDAVSKVKLFAGASTECQTALASSLARCIVEPETEIVRFGEVGTIMYMVAHGYADVILGNGKIVTTFTRGDCFGEMALVQKDAKRTATVRALTYCDLWTLEKQSFLEALAMFPEFLKTVEAEVVNRKGNAAELRDAVRAVNLDMLHVDDSDESSSAESDNAPAAAADSSEDDVHVEHGIHTRWTDARLETFKRMSVFTVTSWNDPNTMMTSQRRVRPSMTNSDATRSHSSGVPRAKTEPHSNAELQRELLNAENALAIAKSRLGADQRNSYTGLHAPVVGGPVLQRPRPAHLFHQSPAMQPRKFSSMRE